MKSKKQILLVGFLVIVLATFAIPAAAETLSWGAVTNYTDGTSIGGTTVTYQAYWSTSSALTNLRALGAASTYTSRTFNIDTEAMPRGSVVYFTCRSTVGGVNSALATPLSWSVPTVASKAPSAPTNVQIN